MWELVGAERDRPETWPDGAKTEDLNQLYQTTDSDIHDLYTDTFSAALEQITGKPLSRPEEGELIQAIVMFPAHQPFKVTGAHVDNAVEAWGLKTFPTSNRATTLVYLNDVEPEGGGTAIWPGWPAKLVERMRADPERYDLLYAIQAEISSGEIDLGEPMVATPRAGEVLIIDTFMPHSSTINVDKRPRFAIQRQVRGDQPIQFPEHLEAASQEFRKEVLEYIAEQRKLGRRRAHCGNSALKAAVSAERS
jgi:hypothetical protein